MRIARRLLNATFIALVSLVSGVIGFWVYRLAGSANQVAVQWPVAVLSGTVAIAILALWAILIPQVLIAGAVSARRLNVVAACLVCCALVGCGSDNDATSPHTLMVGDVGELISEHNPPDGSYSVFLYRGISFYGDMPLAEFLHLKALVSPELAVGEEIVTIYNYEVLPPSTLPGRGEEDASLWTCTDGGGDTCRAGRFWSVSLDDGVMAVLHRGLWRTD